MTSAANTVSLDGNDPQAAAPSTLPVSLVNTALPLGGATQPLSCCWHCSLPSSTPRATSSFVQKCAGVPGEKPPPLPKPTVIALSGLTSFLGMLAVSLPQWYLQADTHQGVNRPPCLMSLAWPLLAYASRVHGVLICCTHCVLVCALVPGDVFLLIGSFAATAVLVYAAPEGPLSQPRNVVGGHAVSAFIGMCIYKLSVQWEFGFWLSAPLAVSLAIVAMQVTKTLHPPGGATAMIIVSRPVKPFAGTLHDDPTRALGFLALYVRSRVLLFVLADVSCGARVADHSDASHFRGRHSRRRRRAWPQRHWRPKVPKVLVVGTVLFHEHNKYTFEGCIHVAKQFIKLDTCEEESERGEGFRPHGKVGEKGRVKRKRKHGSARHTGKTGPS